MVLSGAVGELLLDLSQFVFESRHGLVAFGVVICYSLGFCFRVELFLRNGLCFDPYHCSVDLLCQLGIFVLVFLDLGFCLHFCQHFVFQMFFRVG